LHEKKITKDPLFWSDTVEYNSIFSGQGRLEEEFFSLHPFVGYKCLGGKFKLLIFMFISRFLFLRFSWSKALKNSQGGPIMIISDSIIQLSSERTAVERNVKRESLAVWRNEKDPKLTRTGHKSDRETDSARKSGRRRRDSVSLSHHHRVKRRQLQPAETQISEEQKLETDLNVNLLRSLFERLTGQKFRVIDPTTFTGGSAESAGGTVSTDQGQAPAAIAANDSAGYGLAYDYHESHYEAETTQVAAAGIINTADGQKIDFSLSLSMSHEFYSEQNLQIRAGDALKDPLVINFSGTAAELTQREFQFDIDADGHKDQISFVGPESGFLALDKNSDGIINDGSELFGTASGNGFSDLSAYDSDGNNWIDENDAIFDSLRIWSKDSAGEDQLVALGKAGVGALYLGHIESLFSIKETDNTLLGQVKETGLAVMESGQVVTMQQLDLVV